MQPYAPRRITFLGLREHAGWRLKQYSIVYGDTSLDADRFEEGIARVLPELPQPPSTDARAGVGLLILHQGLSGDYAVLAWWDRENELPLRLAVRGHGPLDRWRAPERTESICVWDLQVLSFERDAYVDTLLATPSPRPEDAVSRYLARTLQV